MNRTVKISKHPRLKNAFEVKICEENVCLESISFFEENVAEAYEKAKNFAVKKAKDGYDIVISVNIEEHLEG